jgi:hypothetical protein
MAYSPSDHIPTRQGILAAWILCAAIGTLGLALPALSHDARPPAGGDASRLSIAECLCTGAVPGTATLPHP